MTKRALATVEKSTLLEPFEMFGVFSFTSTGIDVRGRPTFEETQAAFDFVLRAVKCSGFWMVDLIKHIESREDFGDRRDALISAETGLTEGTVKVYRSLGKSLPPENRVEGVPFGHHQAVASLEPDQQVEWLEKSKDEGWTQAELRTEVRNSKHKVALKGKAPAVQHLEITVKVAIEARSFTKAADLGKAEIKRLLKSHGPVFLDATVGAVKAAK